MPKQYPRGNTIPGVTGRRVPGTARLPKAQNLGGFSTRVPYIDLPKPRGSSTFREYHRQQVKNERGQFAGGWGMAWIGLDQVDDDVYRWARGLQQDFRKIMEDVKDEMVAYAKANAPWEDDTGLARDSLQGVVVDQGNNTYTIFLGHGSQVHYGIWLEVRWGGKYAILLPTLEVFRGRAEQRVRTMT